MTQLDLSGGVLQRAVFTDSPAVIRHKRTGWQPMPIQTDPHGAEGLSLFRPTQQSPEPGFIFLHKNKSSMCFHDTFAMHLCIDTSEEPPP